MNEAELIIRTAAAIKRGKEAFESLERARAEDEQAGIELRSAWAALRDYQDNQVKSALRLVA